MRPLRAGDHILGLCYGVLLGLVVGAAAGFAAGGDSLPDVWQWMLAGGAVLAIPGALWPRMFGFLQIFG